MTLESILAEPKPIAFINDLADFIVDPNISGVTPLDLETAPSMIRGIILLNAFDLATSNSGIWRWFDQDYDDHLELENFLAEIGAKDACDYIRAATALFPNGRVPEDSDARFDFVDEHGRKFHEIDRHYKDAGEKAILKLREYILAHRETFETQAKAFWELRKSNKPKWRKKIQKYRRLR